MTAIDDALAMIGNMTTIKNRRDQRNFANQELLEMGQWTTEPVAPRFLESKLAWQAVEKMIQKTKFLDYQIHGTGRPEWAEKMVAKGITTVLENGGFDRAFSDKAGVKDKMYAFADVFVQIGTDAQNPENPITFNVLSNSNVYFDNYAITMRGGNNGSCVQEMAVIFSYPWAQATKLHPKLKRKGSPGQIPRDIAYNRELEKTWQQEVTDADITEICYYYNLTTQTYTVFGGAGCLELETKRGEAYPFMMDGKPYIPVIHFKCLPSSIGFYNRSLVDIIYDISISYRQILNQALFHAQDNINPYILLNLPTGESSEFFNKLAYADELRAEGQKGYIPVEYDAGGANGVNAQPLTTQNNMAEFQILREILTDEVKRIGVNLNDIDYAGNPNEMQILKEEENSQALAKRIMAGNRSEIKFLLECVMDFIAKYAQGSEVPLNLTTTLTMIDPETGESVDVKAEEANLGMVADELNNFHYFAEVDGQSGAEQSNVMEQTQIDRALSVALPGTPAYFKLAQQKAMVNNRDITVDELQPPAPEAPEPEMTPPEAQTLT